MLRCAAQVGVLPADGRVMLRVGMTNPPFILEHLEVRAWPLFPLFSFSFPFCDGRMGW